MRRLPVAAFVALVIATVAAFFVTQHLKVTTPLVAGTPAPVPSVINPVSGGFCPRRNHLGETVLTDYRRMQVSFYLLNRADDVDVYIVNADGAIVDTLASGRHMGIKQRRQFTWNGRQSNGSVAPDGRYDIRVSLVHQGRTLLISNNSGAEKVTVQTHAAPVRVVSVRVASASGAPAAGGAPEPAVIPQPDGSTVLARFSGTARSRPRVLIYRTDLPGGPRLVKSYNATSKRGRSLWDGTLQGGAPAPQGTYLIGLRATDRTCTVSRFPATLPPAPGSTPHAGVTVRYLAAQPPMTPVAAGATAVVDVDARQHRYSWTLRRAGARAVLRSGSSSAVALHVRLPGGGAGLYTLSLRWGPHRTTVPLVAHASGGGRPRVLVVLPSLTWQGLNPVDDDGDGIPNTLTSGEPVRLARPLVDGLPAGFADEAALIGYLRRARLRFDLTTDLGLVLGQGPQLHGASGVVLAGSERWLPESLGSSLSTFVERGGHVLSLGIDSLRRTVTVSGGQAMDPSGPHAVDALLARPGPVRRTAGALILVDRDGLGIFTGTSQALRGYRSYQSFGPVQSPAVIASSAGVSSSEPAIIGYRLGHGDVVAVGLPGFGSSLAGNVDAQELLGRVWGLLSR